MLAWIPQPSWLSCVDEDVPGAALARIWPVGSLLVATLYAVIPKTVPPKKVTANAELETDNFCRMSVENCLLKGGKFAPHPKVRGCARSHCEALIQANIVGLLGGKGIPF